MRITLLVRSINWYTWVPEFWFCIRRLRARITFWFRWCSGDLVASTLSVCAMPVPLEFLLILTVLLYGDARTHTVWMLQWSDFEQSGADFDQWGAWCNLNWRVADPERDIIASANKWWVYLDYTHFVVPQIGIGHAYCMNDAGMYLVNSELCVSDDEHTFIGYAASSSHTGLTDCFCLNDYLLRLTIL